MMKRNERNFSPKRAKKYTLQQKLPSDLSEKSTKESQGRVSDDTHERMIKGKTKENKRIQTMCATEREIIEIVLNY